MKETGMQRIKMENLFLAVVAICLLPHSLHAADIQLTADPLQLIPVLAPSLTVTCQPGPAVDNYREVYYLQLTKEERGEQQAVASLRAGQAPAQYVADPNMITSGRLVEGSPSTARLEISVHNPTAQHAGLYRCEIEGLGPDGEEVYKSAVVNVTVHPQSEVANLFLKVIVSTLREETEAIQQQTTQVLAATQQLENEIAAKRRELEKRKVDLQNLRNQVEAIRAKVSQEEAALNATAEDLLFRAENLSLRYPASGWPSVSRSEQRRTTGQGCKYSLKLSSSTKETGTTSLQASSRLPYMECTSCPLVS
ncbi:uncharacterized protein LOC112574452 [Pomacea canaliculata]|uniref:uncharacterized protein LOC112574452 n=1 Tax=Pomacea canaliculata TaxID=400727 RepID=UPI000D72E487|nr:uncharacterized protein LOC112574452 [Pomacea canaliculata]